MFYTKWVTKNIITNQIRFAANVTKTLWCLTIIKLVYCTHLENVKSARPIAYNRFLFSASMRFAIKNVFTFPCSWLNSTNIEVRYPITCTFQIMNCNQAKLCTLFCTILKPEAASGAYRSSSTKFKYFPFIYYHSLPPLTSVGN
jgi:hypothetical protein